MVDLNQILQNEMKISTLALRFGFSDEVSILNNGSYQPGKALTLTLVVLKISKESDDSRCPDFFATKLSDELGCKVKVLAFDKKPASSAELSNPAAVCGLFNIKFPHEIVMKERDKSKKGYAERLRAADDYLKQNAKLIEIEAMETERKRLKWCK